MNFALVTGAGIQVDVSPCISFRADAEYAYSKMVFGFNTATGARYENRVISYINTSLALIIVL